MKIINFLINFPRKFLSKTQYFSMFYINFERAYVRGLKK